MTEPSYKDWFVGQKVVCIKRDRWQGHREDMRKAPKPKYREICTIAALTVMEGSLYIRVEGYHPGDWFGASRFRPLVTRKTDISVFTEMLRGTRNKVSA